MPGQVCEALLLQACTARQDKQKHDIPLPSGRFTRSRLHTRSGSKLQEQGKLYLFFKAHLEGDMDRP